MFSIASTVSWIDAAKRLVRRVLGMRSFQRRDSYVNGKLEARVWLQLTEISVYIRGYPVGYTLDACGYQENSVAVSAADASIGIWFCRTPTFQFR